MIDLSMVRIGEHYMVGYIGAFGRSHRVIARAEETSPTLTNNEGRPIRLPYCVRLTLLEPVIDQGVVTTEVVVDSAGLTELSVLDKLALAAREAA